MAEKRKFLNQDNTTRQVPNIRPCRMPSDTDTFTLSQISKWSCKQDDELPPVESIRSISIIDFDNTLFKTPLPNRDLWRGNSTVHLQERHFFKNGGWWHDSRILAATGRGMNEEETRAWRGHWNEDIVEQVHLACGDPDTLTVLLTGRGIHQFSSLITRIVNSRNLVFDMIVLRPEQSPTTGQLFSNTGAFKTKFLEELLHTYALTHTIRIYEDRAPHCIMFRQFGEEYNKTVCLPEMSEKDDNALNESLYGRHRCYVKMDVIHIPEFYTFLDPAIEIDEVRKMVLDHNMSMQGNRPTYTLKKTVIYTGYLLSSTSKQELLNLFDISASKKDDDRIRFLADTIMIMPRSCPDTVLNDIGGLGSGVDFVVVATGTWDDSIWAVRVEPVNPKQRIYTYSRPPVVVLGHSYKMRPHDIKKIQHWRTLYPGDPLRLQFSTTIGEKIYLELEEQQQQQQEQPPQNYLQTSRPLSLHALPHPYEGRLTWQRGKYRNRFPHVQHPNRSAYNQAHRLRGVARADQKHTND